MRYLPIILSSLLFSASLRAGSDDPIVTQGDSVVTQAEFDARISLIPPRDRRPFLSSGGRVEKILRELILDRRVADAAREAGFDKQDWVRTRLRLVMEKALADAWLDSIEWEKREAADFEQAAKEYYLTHPDEFRTAESIDVAHILIKVGEHGSAEAESLAREIYQRLKQDPGLWDELVRQYSEDNGSRGNGGRYTGVSRGKMVKPFEDAAFAMELGQISEPVRSRFGYHIIRLDARREAGTMPFEAVKEQLVARQKKEFGRRARSDYLSKLNTSEPIIIPDCAAEEMLARYFDDDPGVVKAWKDCQAKNE